MFVIAAFNYTDKNAIVYTAIKSEAALLRNVSKALKKGAKVISIRQLIEETEKDGQTEII